MRDSNEVVSYEILLVFERTARILPLDSFTNPLEECHMNTYYIILPSIITSEQLSWFYSVEYIQI